MVSENTFISRIGHNYLKTCGTHFHILLCVTVGKPYDLILSFNTLYGRMIEQTRKNKTLNSGHMVASFYTFSYSKL